MDAKQEKGTPVLVTTEHRGVFFGYLVGEPSKEKVMLTQARNCVYWEQQVKGVFGLAATGPTKGCKVGPPVDTLTLWDITGVGTCTAEAVKAWETVLWKA